MRHPLGMFQKSGVGILEIFIFGPNMAMSGGHCSTEFKNMDHGFRKSIGKYRKH